jgi:hypothetical protein
MEEMMKKTTIRGLLAAATLAAVAVNFAAPASAGWQNGVELNSLTVNGLGSNGLGSNALNPNALNPNGLTGNGLTGNGLTGNGTLQGYLSGFTVEAIELPDGTVLGR